MRGFVSGIAFPGVGFVTELPKEGPTFLMIESEHLRVPCLRRVVPDARCSIVYCHGNAMAISEMENRADLLCLQLHANVFIFEIPGVQYDWGRFAFKGEPQKASEEFYNEAASATFDFVSQSIPNLPIVIWGQSLGSGAATELALRKQEKAAALILQSPLMSCIKVASLSLPSLWGCDVFINHRKAGKIPTRVLIFHGSLDEVIHVEHGRRLSQLFENLVEYVEFDNCGHNNMEAKCWKEMAKHVDALIKLISSKQ